MTSRLSAVHWSPFWALPGHEVRQFGQTPEDLEVDFEQGSPHRLTTQILSLCLRDARGHPLNPDQLWDLAVGERIAWLLTIATQGGPGHLPLLIDCENPTCGERLEIEIAVADLLAYQRRAARQPHVSVDWGEDSFTLALPKGRDLELWSQAEHAEIASLVRALLPECDRSRLPEPLPEEWLEAARTALSGVDPLVDFRLDAVCPACGSVGAFALDLKTAALERLYRARQRLLIAVHRLALAYHWREEDILALPARRRAEYLSLLDRSAA